MLHLTTMTAVARNKLHHGFPSLATDGTTWWCAFRSGRTHVSDDGTVEIWREARTGRRASAAGRDARPRWRRVARLRSPDPALADLRDPRLLQTPTGIAVVATGTRRGEAPGCRTFLWTSTDGATWDEPRPLGPENTWLWSLTHRRTDDRWLAVTYPFRDTPAADRGAELWLLDPVRAELTDPREVQPGRLPNETGIVDSDDGLRVLVRRFADEQSMGDGTAVLGRPAPGDAGWTFTDTDLIIGGPTLHRLPDGRLLAGGRVRDPEPRTVLWQLTEDDRLVELLALPSGGDCGYPAMINTDTGVRVIWYSSHEGPTGVYVADLTVD
ncbi:hypothetical protein ACQBAU_16570 [Propionibacteriaceae bacterium Y2011]|uniref:hypothetical protein n=1 Tax=Microlunatus sp. Y2014 TaxID=3418488 RepID=UPI003B4DED43